METTPFAVGQRWISDTESDLGLGTVFEVEFRQIAVVFLASGETRRYAKASAPLTRVVFTTGDIVTSHEGWELDVESVIDEQGVYTYVGKRRDTGEKERLPEGDLSNQLQFRSPKDRLFTGLIEGQRWFHLRRRVFEYQDMLARSPARGLAGARISLLPHQLYIAVEATRRLHPRVLLADEVGLGKTIEAGLILHRQLVRQQVSRVLVIVPPALLHQWLVEMLRKFNLTFSIMDDERFEALQESAPEGNPFLAEQRVLCTLDTLLGNPLIAETATAAGWDMLIADEAHHLEWSPGLSSPAYQLVETLAGQTPSVLLLTATPEQLGQAGHFARLRLLDPDRFADLERWKAEEAGFSWVAEVAERLSRDQALDAQHINQIEARLDEPFDERQRQTLSADTLLAVSDLGQSVLDQLIDRHGTGRLLFRNTRHAITGFPTREYLPATLPAHEPHATHLGMDDLGSWMIELLAEHLDEKILVICASKDTVQALAEWLRMAGVDSARFHEDMSIVERDRAAAWFGGPEESCRLLICSEIGSEGRNFQFLHRLVTFELPASADLLEQRIGRLDRIGQQHDIQIHVPMIEGSRDHRLARWFHEGLDAFQTICRTGTAVERDLGELLSLWLTDGPGRDGDHETAFEELVRQAHDLNERLIAELQAGRDRLLELNSNRPERIQEELDALKRLDRDVALSDFMAAVFDRFGVTVEDQPGDWILQPGDHMQVASFPHLPDTGLTVTFSRDVALAREDLTFLSWDHPMVTAAMDLILDEGYGQADAQVISVDELPTGMALIESWFVTQCTTDPSLDMPFYLPARLENHIVGGDRHDYTEALQGLDLDARQQRFDRSKLKQVVVGNRALIEPLIEHCQSLAEAAIPERVAEASAHIEQELGDALARLYALQKVNPSVRDEEIAAIERRREALLTALGDTTTRLVAVRVLFNQ